MRPASHLFRSAKEQAGRDPRDVNGDGYVSPLDALVIINYLRRADEGASGEGDSAIPNAKRFAYSAMPTMKTRKIQSIVDQQTRDTAITQLDWDS